MSPADFLVAPAPAALVVRTAAGTFTFETATYDAASDRLVLAAGPPTAAVTEQTPEGHLLAVAVPDGFLARLTLTAVARRLLRDGTVTVTLAPGQVAELDAGDLAHLLTARPRAGRFSRAA